MRIISLLLAFCLSACSDKAPNINLGQGAPGFEAPALSGRTVKFPSEFAGKVLVVRFWADWCRYCEGEMRAIETVYQRQHTRGLEVLAINVGQDRASVESFGRKLGVSYPLLLDEAAGIAKRYGVVGLPTTFFIDGQGVIRGKIVGEADAASFERQAKELLP